MRCFYHADREAIGHCKSCGRALCHDCAADLNMALACRNRCEARALAINQLVDRQIEAGKVKTKVYPTTTTPQPSTPTHTTLRNVKRPHRGPWWKFW